MAAYCEYHTKYISKLVQKKMRTEYIEGRAALYHGETE